MNGIKKAVLTLSIILASVSRADSFERYILPCRSDLLTTSKSIAIGYNGIKELTGRNDGKAVEDCLKLFGLSKGNPYCAAFTCKAFDSARVILKLDKSYLPFKFSPLANGIFNYFKINGIKTEYKVSVHDLIIWKHKNGNSGHIGRIIEILDNKGNVKTIEGNTGGNNPREGNGFYIKQRNIKNPLTRILSVRGLCGFQSV